jgi:hypothetical protein
MQFSLELNVPGIIPVDFCLESNIPVFGRQAF